MSDQPLNGKIDNDPAVVEQKVHLEQILQASKKRAKTFIDKSPLAIQIHATDGLVVEVNKQWEKLWDTKASSVITRFNVLKDKQFKAMGIESFFARACEGESILFPDFEYDPVKAGYQGKKRWIRSHLFKVIDPESNNSQIAMAIQDITSCMLCEERYQILVDNANEAIMVVQDGIVRFFNQKALDIAGYKDQEDYINKPITEFVHPDHRQFIMDQHMRRVKGEAVPNFYQLKILHKKGHPIWLQLNAIKIEWEGRPASLAFLYNITEHKQTEEELENYRSKLEQMVEERTAELKKALKEVRTLKGLIPVCASCKNIRDDGGYWKLMEDYIRAHSDADVTHGICPDCAAKLYPRFFSSKEGIRLREKLNIEKARKDLESFKKEEDFPDQESEN